MSLTIHSKYKYFDSTVQRAEDRRQKFYFCRLPFAVNVKLNLSNVSKITAIILKLGAIAEYHGSAITRVGIAWFQTVKD